MGISKGAHWTPDGGLGVRAAYTTTATDREDRVPCDLGVGKNAVHLCGALPSPAPHTAAGSPELHP